MYEFRMYGCINPELMRMLIEIGPRVRSRFMDPYILGNSGMPTWLPFRITPPNHRHMCFLIVLADLDEEGTDPLVPMRRAGR